MQLNPLDDRVVVQPLDAEEMTAGGIVLPDAAKEKPQRGTVVAVGPGRLLDSGERSSISLVVGGGIFFLEYSVFVYAIKEIFVDWREYLSRASVRKF